MRFTLPEESGDEVLIHRFVVVFKFSPFEDIEPHFNLLVLQGLKTSLPEESWMKIVTNPPEFERRKASIKPHIVKRYNEKGYGALILTLKI